MNALLAPAIALMNRLRYPRKFALLGGVMLIAVAILQFTLYRELSKVIEPSQLELQGIAAVKAMNALIKQAQQHRGLSAAVLSGNAALQERRAAKEKEVGAALAVLAGQLPAAVAASERWQDTLKQWQLIEKEGADWTTVESFARHTQLIDDWSQVMIATADETALTLDPDIDSYYLMDAVVVKLPALLERLGQLRARGATVLTKKAITDLQRMDIGSLLGELQSMQRLQKINLDKIMSYTPASRQVLAPEAKALDSAVEGVQDVVKREILATSFAIPATEYFDLVTKAIDRGYATMTGILFPALEEAVHQRIAAAQRSLYLTLSMTLLVCLVFVYLAMGAYVSMLAGVRQLGAGAEKLAGGHMAERVVLATRDELQEVAQNFNHMAESMQALLRRLQNSAQDLGVSAQAVLSSAQSVSASSVEQSDAASGMAAAIEEMTVSIDSIAVNARAALDVSAQSGELSLEGSRIVDSTIGEMERIADTVNHSAQRIEELGQRSHQISAIVGVIKDIAEQTNLLALNAAIEAARAGEQGRGFAVVADEVRKLAERTAQSTQEISAMIAAIQEGTTGAVDGMKEGVACVSSGVALSRRAGEAIGRIERGTEQVRRDVAAISDALRQQSSASNEIAAKVETIAQMAESNTAAVRRTADTAQNLQRLSATLQAEVDRYSV